MAATGEDWATVAQEWPASRVRKVYRYARAEERMDMHKRTATSGFVEDTDEIANEIERIWYDVIACGEPEDSGQTMDQLINKVMG